MSQLLAMAPSLPLSLVALLLFSSLLYSARAAHVEEATLVAPVWDGLAATPDEVGDATVFLQTSLVTAHRSAPAMASSRAAAVVPSAASPAAAAASPRPSDGAAVPAATPKIAAQLLAGGESIASSEAELPPTVQAPQEVAQPAGSKEGSVSPTETQAKDSSGPGPPLLLPLSGDSNSSSSNSSTSSGSSSSFSGFSGFSDIDLGIRFFGGSAANPATSAERQKKELVVLLVASVVLQVLLLKISSRMSENSGGKQHIDDIISRTDFNQG